MLGSKWECPDCCCQMKRPEDRGDLGHPNGERKGGITRLVLRFEPIQRFLQPKGVKTNAGS